MMEFTLIVWLWMGSRYEELRIEDLTHAECAERVSAIYADRGKSMGKCINRHGRVFPQSERAPRCAQHPCGSPVPGSPSPGRFGVRVVVPAVEISRRAPHPDLFDGLGLVQAPADARSIDWVLL
jgi:hypothetical protein